MEHTIPDGSTVIVKKDVEVADKEVGVFIVDNEPYVKRFMREDKFIMLLSDNREYKSIIVTKCNEFYTVGKVVQVMYRL